MRNPCIKLTFSFKKGMLFNWYTFVIGTYVKLIFFDYFVNLKYIDYQFENATNSLIDN